MKRVLSLIICLSILISLTGCSKSPRLDLKSFEKYATADLHIEKKDISAQDPNAYYDLDSTIDNTDASPMKRDHYAQVYSKAEGNVISNLYMIYTDYQVAEEARTYFDDLVTQEKDMLAKSESQIVTDSGDDHLLVLTQQNEMTWKYECLYIHDDVILFAVVILAASDISRLNTDWLKMVKTLFKDLRIPQPFTLSPQIDKLIK
ncbi:MAG: hypothetical protein J5379_01270 [Clostridiales bacterium]|nr:hypothetical protein [Clostridiales bacterium]